MRMVRLAFTCGHLLIKRLSQLSRQSPIPPVTAIPPVASIPPVVAMVYEDEVTFTFFTEFRGTATVIRGMTFYYEENGELRGTQWFSSDHRAFLFVSAWGRMHVCAEDPNLEGRVFVWMSYTDWFATARRVPTALLRAPPHVDPASQPPQVD